MEVRRVEALGEPAVELGESLAGCGTLVLALPEPAKDHRRPQFQGLRLLAPGRLQARRNEASALSKASASRRSVSSPSSRWSSGLIGSTRVMKDVNPYIEARREWERSIPRSRSSAALVAAHGRLGARAPRRCGLTPIDAKQLRGAVLRRLRQAIPAKSAKLSGEKREDPRAPRNALEFHSLLRRSRHAVAPPGASVRLKYQKLRRRTAAS